MGRLKDETLRGTKWQMLQKVTMQPLQLLFGMVLARFISPAEMGVLGLTSVFFALAGQLASSGFSSALIRKIERTEEDINTMFWFNVGMSLLMTILLWLAAPWFAVFYNQPDLTLLTRISAVMMLLNSCAGVHWTLYTCRRDFKTPALIYMITALLSMPVCLVLVYRGWSYWGIVAQGVFSGVLQLLIVWKVSPWKPRFVFSWTSFKDLFGFGSNIALTGILNVIYMQARPFIIGKFYSAADLGLFSKGMRFAQLIPIMVVGVIDNVSYPILAELRDDDDKLRDAYSRFIKLSTMVIGFAVMLLAALAVPVIGLCYGPMWLPCVPYVQIISLDLLTYQVSVLNLNLLKVKGRSDLLLRLEILKRSISMVMMLVAATISVDAICWAMVIFSPIAIFANCYYTGKFLGMTWWKQQKEYFPYLIASAVCCLPGYIVAEMPLPYQAEEPVLYAIYLAQICFGGGTAIVLYGCWLIHIKDRAFLDLLQIVRERRVLSAIPPAERLLNRVIIHLAA